MSHARPVLAATAWLLAAAASGPARAQAEPTGAAPRTPPAAVAGAPLRPSRPDDAATRADANGAAPTVGRDLDPATAGRSRAGPLPTPFSSGIRPAWSADGIRPPWSR